MKAEDWAKENGWSDLTFVDGQWWGFAPEAAMPTPLPGQEKWSLEVV